MAVTVRFALLLVGALATGPVAAQQRLTQDEPAQVGVAGKLPLLPATPPAPFKPDLKPSSPDTWIFSGALKESHEQFSGTLVTSDKQTEFEMKLGGGATCSGGDLKGGIGLVRLSEITCTDDRTLHALFVPQGGQELRVFGHVGDERFVTSAHLLGTEAIPEKKQTAAPPGDRPKPPR